MKEFDFPDHKCGLFLTHNEHKNYYQKIEEYIGEHEFKFESDEAKSKCIESDEIWVLQWYPDTPIGSYTIAGPTLEDILRIAREDK